MNPNDGKDNATASSMMSGPDNDFVSVNEESIDKRTSKQWVFYTFVIVLFLSVLFAGVQEYTLQNEEVSGAPREFAYRLILNSTLFSTVFLLFHRYVLWVVFVLQACFLGMILLYFSYFGCPLRISNIIGQFFEGIEAGNSIVSIISWRLCLLLFAVLVLSFALLRLRNRCRTLFWGYRVFASTLFFVGFASFFFVQYQRSSLNDDKSNIRNTRINCNHTGSLIAKLGYLPVMIHDAVHYYGSDRQMILEAAIELEAEQSDLLEDEFVPDIFPKNIVVVQMEALDYSALNFTYQGKEVTPFLNKLSATSLSYRMLASHEYGSATADFVLLNGIPPSKHLLNYSLDGFPYNTSIINGFLDSGYRTFAVHGVRGSFFNRRNAFVKMNFENLYFRQEIRDELQKKDSTFSKRLGSKAVEASGEKWLKDSVVFEFANWILEQNIRQKNFLFLITATSHHPYTNHGCREIVPEEKNIGERYMNAVNGLDKDFEQFYEKLPSGTFVVIYGDHSSCIRNGDFPACIDGKKEFVPLIISVKGKNLSSFQRHTAFDEKEPLTLRDAYSYLKKIAETETPVDRKLMQATGNTSSTVQ